MNDTERPERLERLAELIEADSYRIDAVEVADAVLRRWTLADAVERFEDYSTTTDSDVDSSSP